MTAWNTVIIVGSNAVVVAILAFLGRTFVERWLDRRATEHQTRFSVLHARLAKTIEELYARLDIAMRAARATVAEVEPAETDKSELAKEAYVKAGEFLEYFWPHRLYLSDDLASRLNN